MTSIKRLRAAEEEVRVKKEEDDDIKEEEDKKTLPTDIDVMHAKLDANLEAAFEDSNKLLEAWQKAKQLQTVKEAFKADFASLIEFLKDNKLCD
eukprot:gene19575-26259_t